MNLTNDRQYIINLIVLFLAGNPKEYKTLDWIYSDKNLTESKKWSEAANVANKDQFIKHMNNIDLTYNNDFDNLRFRYNLMDDDKKSEYIKSIKGDEFNSNRQGIIDKYGARLGYKGIIGYEYYIIINRYRHGLALGYINEEEFFRYALKPAKLCQSSYKSWQEYLFAILVGKLFIYNYPVDTDLHREKYYIKRFIDRKYSSYEDTPWGMVLG